MVKEGPTSWRIVPPQTQWMWIIGEQKVFVMRVSFVVVVIDVDDLVIEKLLRTQNKKYRK